MQAGRRQSERARRSNDITSPHFTQELKHMAKPVRPKKEKVKPAPSNVTAGLVQHWGRELSKTQMAVTEAMGVHRSRVKAAKNAGVDTKALLAGLQMRKRDPEEVMAEVKNGLRYLAFLGLPIGAQAGLFSNDGEIADQLTDTERAQQAEWEAQVAGYSAGRAGQHRDANPHPPGTPHHVAWDEHYLKGQAAIAAEMGPGVTPISEGRRQRQGNPEDGRISA
jgi:hypothetical protein